MIFFLLEGDGPARGHLQKGDLRMKKLVATVSPPVKIAKLETSTQKGHTT